MDLTSLFYWIFLGTVVLAGPQIAMAETLWQLDRKSAGGYFARTWRTSACEGAQDPQCPSIERSASGELLLLFTSADSEQEHGVLSLSVSRDKGRTWSEAHVIHRGRSGTPKALGTLTRLWTGKLVAPFVEAGVVRLLVSEDNGQTWQVSDPIDTAPLQEGIPYSRIVSTPAGLLMPIYGKLNVGGTTAPCSGVLRSTDAGKTWGEFTEIACDRESGEVQFGPTAVYAAPDRQLVAMISADNRFLYRSLSNDSGRTWSKPQQRLMACNPTLVAVGSTLACVNRGTAGPNDKHPSMEGVFRVQFSDTGFDSWRCDRMLDQDLKGEWGSAIGLDNDRLLLVHDRGLGRYPIEGRGTRVTEGIEVAEMVKNPTAPQSTPTIIDEDQRDGWVFGHTFTSSLNYFGAITPAPDGTLFTNHEKKILVSYDMAHSFQPAGEVPAWSFFVLRSGRWISAESRWNEETMKWDGDATYHTGEDGYLYEKRTGIEGTNELVAFWSDDQGKTWNQAQCDQTPLLWCAGTHPFEDTEGTLILPAFGCFTHEQTSSRIDSAGLYRSTDGGKTWGDFSLIASDAKGMEIAYNETAIQPMPDGTWVAIMRTEWRSHNAGEAASSSVSFSTDRGRTWTKPEFAFIGAVPQSEVLSDGALLVATSFSRWRLSYDGGHTWSREIPSRTKDYPWVTQLTPDLLMFSESGQHSKLPEAHIYRRIPAVARASR